MNRIVIVLLTFVWTFGCLCHCEAQQNSGAPAQTRGIGVIHTSPMAQELPFPGQFVTLSAQLLNTRDTSRPMRVALVRDGKFLDLDAKPAYLDKNDRPTYDTVVVSPIAEMSYQFLLFNPDGSVTPSQRFFVRRQCQPAIELATGEVPSEVQGNERLKKLVQESKLLENDLNGYQRVLDLLQQLEASVKE